MDPNTYNSTNERIEDAHKEREAFLYAIQTCNSIDINHFKNSMLRILNQDNLNIFNRISGDKLRSYKNFLLSHNTLYSYSAEKGGLNAAKSHFMSEKYAILIEHTDTTSQLGAIHIAMIDEYADPSNRYSLDNNPTIVDRAVNYIETNFAEEITIEEIAQNLHVHASHLMRSFKKEKCITISSFRNRKRLKEAKELLIHSNLSMTDIAIMVGFNNSQYFSKVFKGEEGITPKNYRSTHTKDNEIR